MYCFEIPKPQDAISRILKLDSLKCRLMVVELSRKTKEKNVFIVSRTSAGLHLPCSNISNLKLDDSNFSFLPKKIEIFMPRRLKFADGFFDFCIFL